MDPGVSETDKDSTDRPAAAIGQFCYTTFQLERLMTQHSLNILLFRFTIKDSNFQDGKALYMYITEDLIPNTVQEKSCCHVSSCWYLRNIHCDRFRRIVLVGS